VCIVASKNQMAKLFWEAIIFNGSLPQPIVGEHVSARCILLDKIWCFRIHVEDRWTVKGVNLIFESIEKKDRGNYTCQATVDGKEHTQSFKLVVISELKCFPSLCTYTYIEALAFVSPHPPPPYNSRACHNGPA